jgi:hypothetical protein
MNGRNDEKKGERQRRRENRQIILFLLLTKILPTNSLYISTRSKKDTGDSE